MHEPWDKPWVIDQLRARDGSGRPIYVWQGDYALYAAAGRQFGSWRAALDAAGLPLPTQWTPERVLAAIRHRHRQQMHVTGEWRENSHLFQAAIVHFGSWPDAVRASGVPCEPRWTRERVITSLKARCIQGCSIPSVCDDKLIVCTVTPSGRSVPGRRLYRRPACRPPVHQKGHPVLYTHRQANARAP
jgi:hypothetical protein